VGVNTQQRMKHAKCYESETAFKCIKLHGTQHGHGVDMK